MNAGHSTQVIGIASGKGGVGKTVVSANLAVALSQMGLRVMLFDADLSFANAQIVLGVRVEHNLSHFLSGEKSLDEIVVTTRQGVMLVPGSSGLPELAALSNFQAASIVQAFEDLHQNVDVLIVDIATGIAPFAQAFLTACQRRFVVVNDDPSAIADAYSMIKIMMHSLELDEIYLVPNAVKDQAQGHQLYERMNDACTRFLGQPIKYLLAIEADEQITLSVKKFRSVLEQAPASTSARDFRRLAKMVTDLPAIEQPSGAIQFFIQQLIQGQAR